MSEETWLTLVKPFTFVHVVPLFVEMATVYCNALAIAGVLKTQALPFHVSVVVVALYLNDNTGFDPIGILAVVTLAVGLELLIPALKHAVLSTPFDDCLENPLYVHPEGILVEVKSAKV